MQVGDKDLSSIIGLKDDKNNYEIINVEHHLSHIAASYFTSSFDDSAAMSFDGSGDDGGDVCRMLRKPDKNSRSDISTI